MHHRLYTIYAMVDPKDGAVRYVGMTLRLTRRTQEHLHRGSIATRPWVAALKAQGLKPEFIVLEYTDESLAGFREHYWIDFFTDRRRRLLNQNKRTRLRPAAVGDKMCMCGCGNKLRGKQRWASPACRQRAHRRQQKAAA